MTYYGRLDNEFLDSIELSVRADRLLRAWGRVQSMEDFLNLKRSDFMALKGAGVKTWDEIVHLQRMFLREETRDTPAEPASPQSLSLRDAAALAALQGLLACPNTRPTGGLAQQASSYALRAFEIADAFIAAREGKIE